MAFEFELRREYTEHYLCKQIRALKEIDSLKDVTVRFGTDRTERASSFLLSMLSPAWRAKLCGRIGTNEGKLLNLAEEDESHFLRLLALGCGESVSVGRELDTSLDELIGLVIAADRYQMEPIQGELEDAVIDRLTVENCGRILTMACGGGLVRLERASRELALREFDQFAECDGFMDVSEEALGSLLDDDALVSESEERVLKGVARWMRGGAGGAIRGEGLLRRVRFPFMSAAFLADEARGMLPESTGLEGLVLETGLLKLRADAAMPLRYLDAKVLVPRRWMAVKWAEYANGGEIRLTASRSACAVAAHGGRFVCGGLHDGSIRVWDRATLAVERTLAGHTAAVMALVSVEGWLISGSRDCGIRVWDVAAGRCEGTLEGHTGNVRCLAVSGDRLVSGSFDGTARVWRMEGPVAAWRCERTLDGQGGKVNCVAAWGGKMAVGSADRSIRIWDVAAGTLERTLAGHKKGVLAVVVVSGQRLISASEDGTVRVWSTAAWGCVHTVRAYAAGAARFIMRLAVSGPTLVGGSISRQLSDTEEHEVRVWDLETLEPLHTLRLGPGRFVVGLASDGGQVWGAVGHEVVVWGRRG